MVGGGQVSFEFEVLSSDLCVHLLNILWSSGGGEARFTSWSSRQFSKPHHLHRPPRSPKTSCRGGGGGGGGGARTGGVGDEGRGEEVTWTVPGSLYATRVGANLSRLATAAGVRGAKHSSLSLSLSLSNILQSFSSCTASGSCNYGFAITTEGLCFTIDDQREDAEHARKLCLPSLVSLRDNAERCIIEACKIMIMVSSLLSRSRIDLNGVALKRP
ncbi:DNA-directed RNA polymerase [Musa troglodytarum]|uniref:DNA-directed RNA polymerase n=1 Tax=Musa troglodytarum TaxID=320322 RepID=A0A9E7KHC5_9LILI|nr:DNA-directed RNA polymerase [Musa troglodytarum]